MLDNDEIDPAGETQQRLTFSMVGLTRSQVVDIHDRIGRTQTLLHEAKAALDATKWVTCIENPAPIWPISRLKRLHKP